jgi:peroxiredoxin
VEGESVTQFGADPLKQAEELLRGGLPGEARLILQNYLAGNPGSAQAWWLLSFAAEGLGEKMDAVQHVLRLMPENSQARQRFLKLRAETGGGQAVAAGAKAVPQASTGQSRSKKDRALRWWIGGLAGFFVIVVLAGIALLHWGFQQNLQSPPADLQATIQLAQALTSRPPQILAPTWTPSPGWTPWPSSTPTVTPTITSTWELDLTLLGHVGPYVGYFPPDFSLVDAGTVQKISFSQFKGQPVMLIFMVTRCPACEGEMAALETLYQTYHKDGLVMLGISYAEYGQYVKTVMAQYGLTFPVLLDRDGAVNNLFQIGRWPTHFFIRQDGKIDSIMDSQRTLDELDAHVRPILSGYQSQTLTP